MEVVASLSQGRTAATQCGLFTQKSVPAIFEPPCTLNTELVSAKLRSFAYWQGTLQQRGAKQQLRVFYKCFFILAVFEQNAVGLSPCLYKTK